MVEVGTVVQSLSGKDRGTLLVVVGGDEHRILVADGRHRMLAHPKAKNPRHLRQSGIHEVDCQQLAVSTLATLGSGHYFKPHNPVFVIACQKEENHG